MNNNTPTSRNLCTVAELARYKGCAAATMRRRLASQGLQPVAVMFGGGLRLPLFDMNQMAALNICPPMPTALSGPDTIN